MATNSTIDQIREVIQSSTRGREIEVNQNGELIDPQAQHVICEQGEDRGSRPVKMDKHVFGL